MSGNTDCGWNDEIAILFYTIRKYNKIKK